MSEHAVVIAGGGPTGLMLAGELALGGIDVAIIERRENQDLAGLRALGLHARTIEVFDQRGIADRFLAEGRQIRSAPFVRTALDLTDLPTRHNYFLALRQARIERILADRVEELGVPIVRGHEVTNFAQDECGVDVELSGGRSLRAGYLVGCDGGRSLIRRKAAIAFPGCGPSTSYLIAEIETAEEPAWGIRRSAKGINAFAKLERGARVVLNEQTMQQGDAPTLHDVRDALIAAYGTDYGLTSATYISRFTDMTRQAVSYRDRRVLLAGDAAHVHSPVGGQGLNLGIQDAVNLGWKLARVLHGTSPESLLDTYHAERHPVGARVLRNTMAITAIDRSDDQIDALREMICELLQQDETRRQYTAMISGLDIHYDLGEGHPLLGRRMPDVELLTPKGPLRVFTLLHDACPVLLNLGEPRGIDIAPWSVQAKSVQAKSGPAESGSAKSASAKSGRLRLTDARCDGPWQLPGVGRVEAPTALLIRPDGYVAWVGDVNQQGLADAMTAWFGPPAAA